LALVTRSFTVSEKNKLKIKKKKTKNKFNQQKLFTQNNNETCCQKRHSERYIEANLEAKGAAGCVVVELAKVVER
jgi:hypothetical protein